MPLVGAWVFVGGAAFAGAALLTAEFFGGFFGCPFEPGSGPFVDGGPFPGLFGGACLLSAATLANLKGAKAAGLGPRPATGALAIGPNRKLKRDQ